MYVIMWKDEYLSLNSMPLNLNCDFSSKYIEGQFNNLQQKKEIHN